MYLTPEQAQTYDVRIDASHIALATQIIDQYCGQSFTVQERTERIHLMTNNRRITYGPVVRIIAARGLMRTEHFGSGWTDINVADVYIDGRGEVFLPPTILNTLYDEAEITYESGWEQVPGAVAKACGYIAKQLIGNGGDLPVYKRLSFITPEVADLLAEYVVERRSPLV